MKIPYRTHTEGQKGGETMLPAVLLLVLLTLVLLCRLPLTLSASLTHREETRLQLRYAISGHQREWRFALIRTSSGHQLMVAYRDGRTHPAKRIAPESPVGHMLSLLRHSERSRQYFLRHIHLERLDGLMLIGTHSAAGTALLTGAARSLAVLIPPAWHSRIRLRVVPDFFGEHTSLKARCIIRLHLGTLFVTSAMLLAAHAAQQAIKAREAFRKWNTRSEN